MDFVWTAEPPNGLFAFTVQRAAYNARVDPATFTRAR